ncbi:MAG: hypothetical protein ABH874_07410 [Methanobacteriota archaeon]
MKNKIRIFVALIILLVFITGLFLYIDPEEVSGGHYVDIQASRDVVNVTLILPALISPKTRQLHNPDNKIYKIEEKNLVDPRYGTAYKVEERILTDTLYGKMLKVKLRDDALIEIGSEIYERRYGKEYTDYLSVHKPWVNKLSDPRIAAFSEEFEFDLQPKYNEKLHEVKFRYGLGQVIFPFERIEKGEEFDEASYQKIKEALKIYYKPYLFEKFDTFGAVEFNGNGTIEVNITLATCRIKTFFFMPLPPDARDSVCYNLKGGFTTNQSGEFVPFEVVGFAFRAVYAL